MACLWMVGSSQAYTLPNGVAALAVRSSAPVMGDFDFDDYSTVAAKLVFVLFSGFGILIM